MALEHCSAAVILLSGLFLVVTVRVTVSSLSMSVGPSELFAALAAAGCFVSFTVLPMLSIPTILRDYQLSPDCYLNTIDCHTSLTCYVLSSPRHGGNSRTQRTTPRDNLALKLFTRSTCIPAFISQSAAQHSLHRVAAELPQRLFWYSCIKQQ
eukprot:2657310-Amphidinium_carterae.1